MSIKLAALYTSCASLLALSYAAQVAIVSSTPELWYQHHSYLVTEAEVDKSKALIDKAAAAGYTGVTFWDSSFQQMGNKDWSPDNEDRLKEVMKYARKRHLKPVAEAAPFGWSNDVLAANPNWAEAQRIVGQQFQVSADGKTLQIHSTLPGLVNGNFEAGQTAWFEMGDPNVAVNQGALTITDPPGNARARQILTVKPWRQYHLSFTYKAIGRQVGSPMVLILDGKDTNINRLAVNLHESNDWSPHDYLINSQDSTQLALYLGVWGGAQGTIQFDNVVLEETGLVWVAHRDGAPFKVYDPDNPAKVYEQGKDYNEYFDADMYPHRPLFHNNFHFPPPFTLPAKTSLKPGQIVAADYYAVTPMAHENQVGMCMTEPGVYRWLTLNAKEIKRVSPPESEVLLVYDEIRQANSCLSCRSKNMTPGQLLAASFMQTYQIFGDAMPGAPVWVWSDMFDPFHNAKDNYYNVEGTMAGSWKGLPGNVSILNWNLDKLKDSLTWFSGLNPEQPTPHQQIIAGFYDRGDAALEARRELTEAAGIPGLRGLMYTTWNDDYSKLQPFADAARAAWPDYLASQPKH